MDILHTLFNPLINGITTVLMIVIVIYWLFALIGGLGMDDLDLGIDFSHDVDIDVDAGVDIDHDVNVDAGGDGGGAFLQALHFLNLGRVPFMIVLTVFIFILWMSTLLITHFFDISSWGSLSALLLLPIAIFGLILTGWATKPLAKFFHHIGYNGEKAINFFGCSGKMLSTIDGEKIGAAEFLIGKNPMKLNVRSMQGEKLSYGDDVIITRMPEEGNIYYVIKN
ncbi:OB-fold-containig protein [Dysgonomonas macrotermitis]|uniref:Inner membrane protein YqiJ N-terminal domain-containing protein n=1 Tax=Dysgonomonas macrotermitis TaxID=1346286 RepID=A0A1M5F099_9BACT|nr:OB-fold-containig protein [Dysgonomonas macrotermitis]SHF84682.1 Protein of unknown function [Dysgonomonas macrotermitis]